MKLAIQINEGPYQHQAADSAIQFTKAALEKGHEIFRVFFYNDGVNNGTRFGVPPQERSGEPARLPGLPPCPQFRSAEPEREASELKRKAERSRRGRKEWHRQRATPVWRSLSDAMGLLP